MSRAAMSVAMRVLWGGALIVAVLLAPAASAGGLDPHVDASRLPRSCAACHQGHGRSGSPMLPTAQQALCLSCHGTAADVARQVARGELAAGVEPPLVGNALELPVTHPIDGAAFSRWDSGAVTCTSCHSPHRASSEPSVPGPPGRRKLSPRNPNRFEFELCQSCHGSGGTTTQSLLDISRRTSPSNRSYHPVEAPTAGRSPSVIPALAGREINCTDCHGNSDPAGLRGPHGSTVAYLLIDEYAVADGRAESASAYGLCYRCHDRSAVLGSSRFPLHELHVVEERASCATCHGAHGSPGNRALIRFGEETTVAGVTASARAGRLAFVSTTAGSGTCYLTCHGEDHAPESYGPSPPLSRTLVEGLLLPRGEPDPGADDRWSPRADEPREPFERADPPPPR